jgi:superfamily II DNA or RNA helicase
MPAIVGQRALLRGEVWHVEVHQGVDTRTLLQLRSEDTGDRLTALCPPDEYTILPSGPPRLDRYALAPFSLWQRHHEALRLASPDSSAFAAFRAGRVQVEPYQFAPVARLLAGPRRSLLLADDVGLGKTIEAGICLLELMARGVGKRILLVVPPGLIPQWVDEMWDKFGLEFRVLADAASVDQAQTQLIDGVQPWHFFDRVITSTEYLKRGDVSVVGLHRPWDVVIVDEAHYLAESGTPAHPYQTLRARLGPRLREQSHALLLLTATPHNGHQHSFRSLIELVEPADATLAGDPATVRRRVARTMVRRLKPHITRSTPDGTRVPAFAPREPIQRIEVVAPTLQEREIFSTVSAYCARTVENAADTSERDLVSFAMQIVKKRMLSSRLALTRTIEHRLEALLHPSDDAPSPAELRELQADLPVPESTADRIARRVLRATVSRDARRRTVERRQLKAIQRQLQGVESKPDPKISALIVHLDAQVLAVEGEKAIVFTEYRDTIDALRTAFDAHPALSGRYVVLTGGLTASQRVSRITRFAERDCRVLLATDAASEGLNLQKHCRRVYHVELPWNPNRLEQRNGRVDRHGQKLNPVIAYLFYADSPEDRILDRLIRRIGQMQQDGVSTPDILGILASTRLEEILGAMAPDANDDATAQLLIDGFEAERTAFTRDVAPLLMAGVEAAPLAGLDPTSADPILGDDLEVESLMLSVLGMGARATDVPYVYRIDVPHALQGPDVATVYARATFRRSVAIEFPARDVEFIHRLHPLFRAVSTQAHSVLTARDSGPARAPRIAVRRGAVTGPVAVFTFLERFSSSNGALFAVGLTPHGGLLETDAMALLARDNAPAGEVGWADVEREFAAAYESLVDAAILAARDYVGSLVARERASRNSQAETLREEARRYYDDRLSELAAEEAAERAGARTQTDLFRETRTDWSARRAAAATHRDARLREIDGWVAAVSSSEPETLGALFVFPEE